jgi:hypothetical protein
MWTISSYFRGEADLLATAPCCFDNRSQVPAFHIGYDNTDASGA